MTRRKPLPPSPEVKRTPFAGLPGLEELRSRLPAGDAAAVAPSPAAPAVATATATIYTRTPKLVVRRERKGHGGKTATRIEGFVGRSDEIEAAMKELKRLLGCGASLDGQDVVLQGDLVSRATALLVQRGVRKVVAGS